MEDIFIIKPVQEEGFEIYLEGIHDVETINEVKKDPNIFYINKELHSYVIDNNLYIYKPSVNLMNNSEKLYGIEISNLFTRDYEAEEKEKQEQLQREEEEKQKQLEEEQKSQRLQSQVDALTLQLEEMKMMMMKFK